jgi:hypothetical protein
MLEDGVEAFGNAAGILRHGGEDFKEIKGGPRMMRKA